MHAKEISNTERQQSGILLRLVTQPTCITTDLGIYYLLHDWSFMFKVVRISSDEARMGEPSAVCSHRYLT